MGEKPNNLKVSTAIILNIYPSHLERHGNLNEYINAIRCNYAKRMISGGMSVSEAAFSCGYRNLSYFSKTYKKYFKMLPSETEVIKNNK